MQFKDINLQKIYDKQGYAVLKLLSNEDISQLMKLYQSIEVESIFDFQVSNYEKNPEKNKFIDSEIKKILVPKLDSYFQNYRTLLGFFYIKFATNNSSFYIHKDWNIVDESKYHSIHIWIPLIDTNQKNGNLFFCPFDYISNKKTYRGSPGFEYPAPNFFTKQINKYYQKDIYTNIGQAICFKHNMTHGSRTNNTETVRVAAGISLIFDGAPMVHYHQNQNNEIYEYEVDDNFYLDFDLENPPIKYKNVKRIEI